MHKEPKPPQKRKSGSLIQPGEAEQREVLRLWQQTNSGIDGERGNLPERPDDAVAYQLLDAAGNAMNRGDWQKGVNILRLVVKDYQHSQEAACARRVIDRLAERQGHHGR